jgi:hypothetical protein
MKIAPQSLTCCPSKIHEDRSLRCMCARCSLLQYSRPGICIAPECQMLDTHHHLRTTVSTEEQCTGMRYCCCCEHSWGHTYMCWAQSSSPSHSHSGTRLGDIRMRHGYCSRHTLIAVSPRVSTGTDITRCPSKSARASADSGTDTLTANTARTKR